MGGWLLALVLGCGGGAPPSAELADPLAEARALRSQRRYDAALEWAERAVAQDGSALALLELAAVHAAMGAHAEAAAAYDRAVGVAPEAPDVRHARGHFRLGKLRDAAGAGEDLRAVLLAPEDAVALDGGAVRALRLEARLDLGILHVEDGRPGVGVAAVEAWLAHPDHDPRKEMVARALLTKVGPAVAAGLSRRRGDAITDLRRGLLDAGRTSEARAGLQQILEGEEALRPVDRWDAELGVGQAYAREGRPADALPWLERALVTVEPLPAFERLDTLLELAAARAEAGDAAGALRAVEELLGVAALVEGHPHAPPRGWLDVVREDPRLAAARALSSWDGVVGAFEVVLGR